MIDWLAALTAKEVTPAHMQYACGISWHEATYEICKVDV